MREDCVRAVWQNELDRLELDVIRVERLLKGLEALPVEPWDPPAVPGPMPLDLARRAQDLLDRHERAIAELRRSLTEAQRLLAYTGRVSDAVGPTLARPVYVDLQA
jgi:hypothetical protein